MVYLKTLMAQAAGMFINLFWQPDWRNLVDIAILTVLIYYIIKAAKEMRASAAFKGILMLVVLAWLSDVFEITAVKWILQQVLSVGLLMLAIVFQPELRKMLGKLGISKWTKLLTGRVRKRNMEHAEAQARAKEIVDALEHMSGKRIGALILLERDMSIGDLTEAAGTIIDAEISARLIENIFVPNTPLHDAATLIRNGRIAAAGCMLKLSEDYSISKDLGTRHRAGLWASEETDAIALIVSEETGIISMCRDGKLERNVDRKKLEEVITEVFDPQETAPEADLLKRLSGRKDTADAKA